MNDLEKQIRDQARKLLESKKVDLVIGYKDEEAPLRTGPCFIRDPGNVEQLVWNPFCENNLANYLIGRKERTAMVTKGCDARSIVVLINEKQVEREKLMIIGVGCGGIIDRKKVEALLEGREIEKAALKDNQLIIEGAGFSKTFELNTIMHDSCLSCRHHNPVIQDIMIGKKAEERKQKQKNEYEKIEQFEKKSPEERWAYFNKELSRCIRCYACRNACPMCYCKECFVNQKFPAWLGKTTDLSNTLCFHIMRALHMAGRCADCGACVRACPNNIDLRMLTKKVAKDIKTLFNAEAGLGLKEKPVMASFSEDDPQDFIK